MCVKGTKAAVSSKGERKRTQMSISEKERECVRESEERGIAREKNREKVVSILHISSAKRYERLRHIGIRIGVVDKVRK